METKIIRVQPIPQSVTREELEQIFEDLGVARIFHGQDFAYFEFNSPHEFEVVERSFMKNQGEEICGAQIKGVPDGFVWEFCDPESSNQIDDYDEGSNIQISADQVTSPDSSLMVNIMNCDDLILESMSLNEIKDSIFSEFSSISQLILKKNQLMICFQDGKQIEKLELLFPDKKFLAFGKNAYFSLQQKSLSNFGDDWIFLKESSFDPHDIKNLGSSNGSCNSNSPLQCLHKEPKEGIRKIHKQTSMEAHLKESNLKKITSMEANMVEGSKANKKLTKMTSIEGKIFGGRKEEKRRTSVIHEQNEPEYEDDEEYEDGSQYRRKKISRA